MMTPDPDGGPGATPEGPPGTCDDGIDNDRDGLADCADPGCGARPPCGGSPSDAGPPPPGTDGGSCASVSVEATPVTAPVDIVWIVDSSSSMRDEALRVQDNLNRFSSDITASGVDHRVVVITDPDYVTVPPPLGSDPARYRFVSRDVSSNAPLERLLSEWPRYGDFLRPEAVTHFVVVSDDNSDLSGSSFESQMRSRLGRDFTLDAIVSPGTDLLPCFSALGFAAAPGREYWTLAERTGGLHLSICTADWSSMFEALREAVIVSAALPCSFTVPDPPAGMTFDRDRVNVVHTPAGGAGMTLPRVMSAAACGAAQGWYYDDPAAPTRILLCPGTCDSVDSTAGRIDIALGCETVIY